MNEEQKIPMTAKDVMITQVVTVHPETSIYEAIKMIVEIEISGLIVIDDKNDVVGVLTERDLLVAYEFTKNTKAPVGEYMNKKVISVMEDTSLGEISDLIVKGNVRRVPVLKEGKIVGVVSRRDLLRQVLRDNK